MKKPAQTSRWVWPVRIAGLLVLVGFVPLILGVPVGRRLFWTVAIAALPLGFTVAGFYAWRKACPLALFGQAGRFVGRPGKRKAGDWLARNYPLVQLGILMAALALRNVATNGTPWALAGFLVFLLLVAATVSLVFTGKTWCNYLCPVGLVEKLYSEPVFPRDQPNAQCAPCTACKKNCPDIDLELGYWKEQELPARRTAYYAWPGVVFGFYAYFWLVSGTWDYYFSGFWTGESEQVSGALGPGLFFAPWLPRAVAAPLTLIVAGAVSFALFTGIEKAWTRLAGKKAVVRHRMLALAGFTAFILFYCYAGQPTLRLAPEWLRQAAAITVVFVASVMLVRRWGRSENQYVQEKFARGILRRWEWGDEPPSDDLGDVYVIHTERTKQREARLRAYKETVHDMVADGILSRNELALLDKLRAQLGITDKDHQKVLSELSAEAKLLFDPAYQGSVEKRLQTDQYRRELERLVLVAARQGRAPGVEALEALRAEHGVSGADHDEALAALRREDGPILRQAREALDDADRLRRAIRRAQSAERKRVDGTARVGGGKSPSISFFAFVACDRALDHVERALALLAAARDPVAYGAIRDLVAAHRPLAAAEGLARFDDPLSRRAADHLRDPEAAATAPPPGDVEDTAALLTASRDASPYLRAGAIYVLSRFDDEDSRRTVVEAATSDPHALVRETAIRVLGARGRLTRDVVSRAMEDADPRVSQAVIRAVVPQGGRVTDPGALAQTTKGIGSSDPEQVATLDPRAALETLSTFEKMMLLRNVPLFISLAADDLEELSAIAHERRYPEGAHLCREGEASDEVFILVSGKTQAWVGQHHVLGESGEGSCIGEMAALDKAPRTATVTALQQTRALVLDGKEFNHLLGERPAIAQGVLQVVTRRLRGMIEQAAVS